MVIGRLGGWLVLTGFLLRCLFPAPLYGSAEASLAGASFQSAFAAYVCLESGHAGVDALSGDGLTAGADAPRDEAPPQTSKKKRGQILCPSQVVIAALPVEAVRIAPSSAASIGERHGPDLTDDKSGVVWRLHAPPTGPPVVV